VAGRDEIGGGHLRIDESADGDGAIVGRDARGDAAACIHADREGRAHRRRVLDHHHAKLQLGQTLAEHRHAHKAARVRDHEVHGLGGDLVGGHDEVAFVFAVLVVDDDEDPTLPDLLDRLYDRREPAHHAPLTASDRCTYLPITSVSMFTACPGASRPSVVTASVCGPISNSSPSRATSTTVRHTPLTATLAPTSLPSRATRAATSSRVTSPLRATARTVPTSSTIPVNTATCTPLAARG